MITGKAYVGYTSKSMEERWNEHVSLANDDRSTVKKRAFQNAIKKYGKESFVHEVLIKDIEEHVDACENEIRLIEEHRTLEPNGYNQTKGGDGVKLNEEGRERHRIATKKALNDPVIRQRYLEGIRRSHSTPEFLEKNRAAQRIAQRRPDVIEKKRRKMLEHVSNPEYRSPVSRSVVQLTLTGEFVAKFSSAREASTKTGCNYSKITEVARGLRKKTGGFTWRYDENE